MSNTVNGALMYTADMNISAPTNILKISQMYLEGRRSARRHRRDRPLGGALGGRSVSHPVAEERPVAHGDALNLVRAAIAEAPGPESAGQRVVDPQLALAAWGGSESPLTSRETEVLQLAAQGMEPQEIAAHLRLSVGTVRNYLTTAVTKLNARNRVDAIRIARETGWLL